MLSASIQQANVINHEIQGQRALHPVLLLWQTLRKCHICTFPSFLWPHWLAASQLQPLFLKKKKKKEKHIQILLYTCTFTHICTLWPCQHAHKQSWSFLYQSFTQCWERERYDRAGYRRTQAICDSSLGLFPLILCRHLLSSRTHTHAQTVSGSWASPLLPSMFTDRIVVGLSFQSKLLCLFFSRAHTNRELQEDGPPNKLEKNRHYQTNRTLGLSKQAWERHDGVPVCDGEGWVPMRWQRKS